MNLFSIKKVHYKDIVSYPQLVIEEGIFTFICGKSGSGKSTLLKLLNASISPDCGEILYRSKSISDYDTISLRREVTLASQNIFLFDDTIQNNFLEFYKYREETPPTDAKMSEYLHLCLADFPMNTSCREMSGGERQRIFLSICLSFLPKVLMLDEPTSALDDVTADKLMCNLKNYCQKQDMTLIAITHDMALARRHADALINLNPEV